ncbi:sigma-70 family RNA polymerase sigma factor [Pontibacter litorisediminis]|uniref:sigma-70 family RNA polymerase sigma factor n=1 Tax=Pontibacter litorisediminis TaxID=1846260 RepID=UPI0023ED0A44|nr:sigma-70 family RNA polymerase sigma factor [Pontibacter litorisediminis]
MKIIKYSQASSLWLEYQKALTAYIVSRVKDVDAANDIMQEVLMKVYNACCSDREIQKLDSWLFQIANHAIVDHWRRQKKFTDEMPEPSHEEDNIVWRELAEYVEPLINLLPEKYARPLYLSDIEGVKQADIAEQLNLGLSAAKSRIQRAREMLQKEIQTCCTIDTDASGNVIGFSVKESCEQLQRHRKKIE